jgi:hypothetical protein
MREVIAEVGSEASEKFQRGLDSRVVCVEESDVTVGRGEREGGGFLSRFKQNIRNILHIKNRQQTKTTTKL